jgi:bacillithiol biosynthesis cysteine-adding enzyme BshC
LPLQVRALRLLDPDPWCAALAQRAPWLLERLPLALAPAEALARSAENAAARFSPAQRQELARALGETAERHGASSVAQKAIERLLDPRSVVVVTGQQPGALLGPLYTLLKAAGAVVYARRMEALLGRAVVPVFWVATEDHDVGEVQRVRVPGRLGGHVDVHLWDPVPPGRRMVGTLPVAEPMQRLLQTLREQQALPGPFREEILDLAQELLTPDATLGGHFLALLYRLFARWPLVALDPIHPALRRMAAPLVSSLLAHPQDVAQRVQEGTRAVEAQGQVPQAPWRQGEVGIFTLLDGERTMLEEVEEGWLAPRGRPDLAAPAAWWSQRAQEDPSAFSPAVHTRPLVQQALLPVLGVVLGPGELRYWAQLQELFQGQGWEMPAVWPRPRVTLVGGTVKRLLGRLKVQEEDVLGGSWGEWLLAELRRRDQVGVDQRFDEAEAALRELHGRLTQSLSPLGGDLMELGRTNLQKLLEDLAWYRRKAHQALRQGSDTLVRQHRTVAEHLLPEGHPQDRYWTTVTFLAQMGPGLVDELCASDDLAQPHPLAAVVQVPAPSVAAGERSSNEPS